MGLGCDEGGWEGQSVALESTVLSQRSSHTQLWLLVRWEDAGPVLPVLGFKKSMQFEFLYIGSLEFFNAGKKCKK